MVPVGGLIMFMLWERYMGERGLRMRRSLPMRACGRRRSSWLGWPK